MILVTGANGFLGRHVIRRLAAGGAVRALVWPPDPAFGDEFPGVEAVAGDLFDDAVLGAAVDRVRTVVHLAAKNVDRDGSGFERVNVEGTRRVCRQAAANRVRRMVYVSSVGVYGHGEHVLADESTPVRPDTPFSRSKAAAEELVLGGRGDFSPVVLRHRFVYGEGDAAVVPRLIKAARSYPFWIGGGRAEMSLVWAPDFAEVVARMAAGAADQAGKPIYHVTDGRPIAYREVIRTICRAFGVRPPRVSLPFALLYWPLRLRERLLGIDPEVASSSLTSIRLQLVAQHNSFANDRLMGLLPDLAFTPFAEGFERSLSYYSELDRAARR